MEIVFQISKIKREPTNRDVYDANPPREVELQIQTSQGTSFTFINLEFDRHSKLREIKYDLSRRYSFNPEEYEFQGDIGNFDENTRVWSVFESGNITLKLKRITTVPIEAPDTLARLKIQNGTADNFEPLHIYTNNEETEINDRIENTPEVQELQPTESNEENENSEDEEEYVKHCCDSNFRKAFFGKRSVEQKSEICSNEVYSLGFPKLGKVVIVNIKKYEDDVRLGSEKDVADLRSVFHAIGMEIEEYKGSTECHCIKHFLRHQIAKQDFTDYAMFFIIFMAHGNEEVILTSEGDHIFVNQILEIVDSIESLENKPKILLFQTCRGDRVNVRPIKNEKFKSGVPKHKVDNTPNTTPPQLADCLLAQSTVPGYVSHRHEQHGTWFIQELCHVLSNCWLTDDILNILTKVNRRMSYRETKIDDTNRESTTLMKQMSSTTTMLTKSLFFSTLKINEKVQQAIRTYNPFLEVLTSFWKKITDFRGRDWILDYYYKEIQNICVWFESMKKRQALIYLAENNYLTMFCLSDLLTSGEEMMNSLTVASVILAYSDNALKVLTTIDQENEKNKNAFNFIETFCKMLRIFMAFMPWEHHCCETEIMDAMQSYIYEEILSFTFDKELQQTCYFNQKITVSEIDILCAILGLNSDFKKMLESLGTTAWLQKDMADHVITFLEENERNSLDSNVLKIKLNTIGFNEEKASFIANKIPEKFLHQQSAEYWAKTHINNMFQNHPLLSESPDYPLNSKIQENTFFKHKLKFHEQAGKETDLWIINIPDINSRYAQSKIETFLKQRKQEKHSLFFHGASHDDIVSIVRNGILLGKGSKAQDFSNGDGFYLYTSFSRAKEWARTKYNNPAVVVFNVPDSILHGGLEVDRTNKKSMDTWKEIVNYCRNQFDGDMPEEFKKYAYVRGPICCNAGDLRYNENPKASDKDHLCIKHEALAEDFGRNENIALAIFYKLH